MTLQSETSYKNLDKKKKKNLMNSKILYNIYWIL